jgi:predicted DsbA family dithiol-disulfide isomerase
MKKVYVVSYTYYDYSEVRAVFETEEAAQAFITVADAKNSAHIDIDCVPMFHFVEDDD